MKIRRIARAAITFVVAVVVALAVPVSQLRTVTTIAERCCCPDPTHCHCPTPPPAPGEPHHSQWKSCHRVSHDVVAPPLPAFAAPVIADAPRAAQLVVIAAVSIPAPHAAPASRRPDAPS